MNADTRSSKELFYSVEPSGNEGGCEHCGHGQYWTIVYHDNGEPIEIGTAWQDRETADDICDLMNMAFDAGGERRAAHEPEAGELGPDEVLSKPALLAWIAECQKLRRQREEANALLHEIGHYLNRSVGESIHPRSVLHRKVMDYLSGNTFAQTKLDVLPLGVACEHGYYRFCPTCQPQSACSAPGEKPSA